MGYKVISTEMSTKELLDTAAAKLMAERGEKFTVRDICQAAGVSIGTFYKYYKSKDEVTLERLQYMDQNILSQYDKLSGGSCGERLEELLLSYIFFSARRGLTFSREVYRSILMFTVSGEEARKRALYRVVYELIDKGQQEGEFAGDRSPEELTNSTLALIRGLSVNWCHRGGSYDLEEGSRVAISVWIRGLKK